MICPHCHATIQADAQEGFFAKLVNALRHPVPSKAALAAQVLGELGDPRGVEPLLQALDQSHDPELQEAAIRALGELRDVRAANTLVRVLEDPNTFITLRVAAVEALDNIGGDEAVGALQRAAQSDEHAPGRAACKALEERSQQGSRLATKAELAKKS